MYGDRREGGSVKRIVAVDDGEGVMPGALLQEAVKKEEREEEVKAVSMQAESPSTTCEGEYTTCGTECLNM